MLDTKKIGKTVGFRSKKQRTKSIPRGTRNLIYRQPWIKKELKTRTLETGARDQKSEPGI